MKRIGSGVDVPNDFEQALAVIAQSRPDALFVVATPVVFAQRRQICKFASQQKLPAIYSFREFPEMGGLLSYGPIFPICFVEPANM